MKIAVFGGTFDPIHLGHTGLADEVIRRSLADRVLFIPSYRPPHKPGFRIAPYEARREMLRLATAGHPRFLVSDLEAERDEKSYTIETLRILSGRGDGNHYVLLIGSDSLRTLHLWYHAHALVRDFELMTYPRRGEVPEPEELRTHWSPEEVGRLLAGFHPELPEFPCSSTEIRSGNHPEMLDPAVLEWIRSHGTYDWAEVREMN